MALSDVIKKREVTNESKESENKKSAKNILDDVRIVIAVIVLASIALIALIVYTNGQIEQSRVRIDSVKEDIRANQNKIANLKALQTKSGEYLAQKEAYDEMISEDGLDQLEIMIALETDVEAHNCNLSEVTFGDQSNNGYVNQMPVNVRISGNFRDILSFCSDTVNQTKIKRIDSIRVSGTGDEKTAEITIVFFSK